MQVRDIDFYLLRDGKIAYNWCMLDLVDLMIQAGYDVLPLVERVDIESYSDFSAK